MNILITGANGQIGKELAKQYHKKKGINLILTDILELDVTNVNSVNCFVNENKPNVIINCAALTDVEKCEEEINRAYMINTIGPKNLAAAANQIGAEIVQVSTDYVFAGNVNKPLTEFDEVNPQTIYGKTKLEGEILVKNLNPKHYIVRTSWLYGHGDNFVENVLDLSKTNKTLKVVNNQKGTPTSTVDLGKVIIKLVEDKNYGLFHCTCKGECTWYEFTKEIFRLKGITTEVIRCNANEFKRQSERPEYSVLRNYMLELTTGDSTRHWKEAIGEYLK